MGLDAFLNVVPHKVFDQEAENLSKLVDSHYNLQPHENVDGYLAVASSVLAKQAPIADHAGEHGNFFSEIVAAAKAFLPGVGDANEKPQVDPLKPFPALSMPPEAEQSLLRHTLNATLRHKMQLADHDLKKLDGVRKILEEGFQREENNAEASLIRRSLEVHLQQKMDSAQKSLSEMSQLKNLVDSRSENHNNLTELEPIRRSFDQNIETKMAEARNDLDRIESMQKQLEDSDSQNNVEAALKLRMREEPNFEYPNESAPSPAQGVGVNDLAEELGLPRNNSLVKVDVPDLFSKPQMTESHLRDPEHTFVWRAQVYEREPGAGSGVEVPQTEPYLVTHDDATHRLQLLPMRSALAYADNRGRELIRFYLKEDGNSLHGPARVAGSMLAEKTAERQILTADGKFIVNAYDDDKVYLDTADDAMPSTHWQARDDGTLIAKGILHHDGSLAGGRSGIEGLSLQGENDKFLQWPETIDSFVDSRLVDPHGVSSNVPAIGGHEPRHILDYDPNHSWQVLARDVSSAGVKPELVLDVGGNNLQHLEEMKVDFTDPPKEFVVQGSADGGHTWTQVYGTDLNSLSKLNIPLHGDFTHLKITFLQPLGTWQRGAAENITQHIAGGDNNSAFSGGQFHDNSSAMYGIRKLELYGRVLPQPYVGSYPIFGPLGHFKFEHLRGPLPTDIGPLLDRNQEVEVATSKLVLAEEQYHQQHLRDALGTHAQSDGVFGETKSNSTTNGTMPGGPNNRETGGYHGAPTREYTNSNGTQVLEARPTKPEIARLFVNHNNNSKVEDFGTMGRNNLRSDNLREEEQLFDLVGKEAARVSESFDVKALPPPAPMGSNEVGASGSVGSTLPPSADVVGSLAKTSVPPGGSVATSGEGPAMGPTAEAVTTLPSGGAEAAAEADNQPSGAVTNAFEADTPDTSAAVINPESLETTLRQVSEPLLAWVAALTKSGGGGIRRSLGFPCHLGQKESEEDNMESKKEREKQKMGEKNFSEKNSSERDCSGVGDQAAEMTPLQTVSWRWQGVPPGNGYQYPRSKGSGQKLPRHMVPLDPATTLTCGDDIDDEGRGVAGQTLTSATSSSPAASRRQSGSSRRRYHTASSKKRSLFPSTHLGPISEDDSSSNNEDEPLSPSASYSSSGSQQAIDAGSSTPSTPTEAPSSSTSTSSPSSGGSSSVRQSSAGSCGGSPQGTPQGTRAGSRSPCSLAGPASSLLGGGRGCQKIMYNTSVAARNDSSASKARVLFQCSEEEEVLFGQKTSYGGGGHQVDANLGVWSEAEALEAANRLLFRVPDCARPDVFHFSASYYYEEARASLEEAQEDLDCIRCTATEEEFFPHGWSREAEAEDSLESSSRTQESTTKKHQHSEQIHHTVAWRQYENTLDCAKNSFAKKMNQSGISSTATTTPTTKNGTTTSQNHAKHHADASSSLTILSDSLRPAAQTARQLAGASWSQLCELGTAAGGNLVRHASSLGLSAEACAGFTTKRVQKTHNETCRGSGSSSVASTTVQESQLYLRETIAQHAAAHTMRQGPPTALKSRANRQEKKSAKKKRFL